MATIRHSLHQEILQPLDERLLAFVQVNKALKKKKPSYLCASVTKDPPTVAYIHQVHIKALELFFFTHFTKVLKVNIYSSEQFIPNLFVLGNADKNC